MLGLEDILQKYGFAKKNKSVWLKKPVSNGDDDLRYFTVSGAKAYSKLVGLLYDVASLTGYTDEINEIIENLDQIEYERY